MLRKDFRRKKRQGGKMDPQWLGSYQVTHDLGRGFYTLGHLQNGSVVTQRINGAHLKVYLSTTIANVSVMMIIINLSTNIANIS